VKDVSLEALAVLIVLLPGFLAARLVQSFANRNKQSDFDKVIEALVYTFVIYLVYSLWGHGLPIDWKVTKDATDVEHYLVEFHSARLLSIGGIAIGLAILAITDANHDLSGKLLRFFRLSRHTTRPTIWSDSFHEYGGAVQVELKDGRQVIGWLSRYSSDPQESALFLSHAHWLDDEGEEIPIPGKGILLTKASGITHVMFLDLPQPQENKLHHEKNPDVKHPNPSHPLSS
jgi:hypothetical protein